MSRMRECQTHVHTESDRMTKYHLTNMAGELLRVRPNELVHMFILCQSEPRMSGSSTFDRGVPLLF
jgi:hypothetical protein